MTTNEIVGSLYVLASLVAAAFDAIEVAAFIAAMGVLWLIGLVVINLRRKW